MLFPHLTQDFRPGLYYDVPLGLPDSGQ